MNEPKQPCDGCRRRPATQETVIHGMLKDYTHHYCELCYAIVAPQIARYHAAHSREQGVEEKQEVSV